MQNKDGSVGAFVSVFEKDKYKYPVILVKEREHNSPEVVGIDFKTVLRLAGEQQFYLLIDLSDAGPPSLEVRMALKRNWIAIQEQYVQALVITGKNNFINIAAKFVFASAGVKNYRIFTNLEQALATIPLLNKPDQTG
jgi:hypothetical protein